MGGESKQEIDKFKSIEELIEEYYGLVKKNKDGLPPYATFAEYLKDDCENCINRPKRVKELINILSDSSKEDNEKIIAIIKLWSTGKEINVKGFKTQKNSEKLIHSVSNTTRLQVCIDDNEDGENGKIINKENLLKFANAIGEYIKKFDDENEFNKDVFKHNLVETEAFKNILNNNIDAAVNEILFWYYYDEDKYPIINSRAKNSRHILNQAFPDNPDNKVTNDFDFNQKCMDIMKNKNFQDIENNGTKITKQLMLDQLFYSIDEMKSMKKVDEKYSDKNDQIYKFYQKLWNTIKDYKNVVNNADFFDELLKKSKNIILYGAPGTGKTHTSENNIKRLIEENKNNKIKENRFVKVQFHPSYSYEDFIEGLKPKIVNGNVALELKDGEFMQFCKVALKYQEEYHKADKKDKMKWAFFFLVDEINRAELSRVFGEAMYALEKRGQGVSTQYSYLKKEKEFIIPENIYFIGTMNDVDRSIDSFDIALRRRFFWYRMDCDYSVIFNELESKYSNIGELGSKNIPDSGYLKACYDLNQYITSNEKDGLGLGKLYELGHSYFLNIQFYTEKNNEKKVSIENKHLNSLFEFSIEPLLKEYLRAEYSEDEIMAKLANAKKIFTLSKKANNDTDS